MHRHLGIANSAMGQQATEAHSLSLSTKLLIYSLLVLSVLLYRSETWTIHKTDSERLQAIHMISQQIILPSS